MECFEIKEGTTGIEVKDPDCGKDFPCCNGCEFNENCSRTANLVFNALRKIGLTKQIDTQSKS